MASPRRRAGDGLAGAGPLDLAATLHAVTDTVFVFELATGRPVFWNRAFVEVSGCSPEEIAARRAPDDWYSPEDVQRALAHQERLAAGERAPLEMELITRRGDRVPFEYVATPLADEAGTPRHVVVIGREVTERRQREEALREGERRYRELYTKAPVMLHSIDREGRILSVSDRWLERLGYSWEEVIGHRSTEFLTEESRRFALEKVLPDFFRLGYCTDVPYCFIAKSGEEVDVLLSAISERDPEGTIVRSMAVLLDVTERRRVEEEKLRLEAQLQQSQKMEAVGRLAGGVAHDFNNLLTGILGNVELALLDLDPRDPLTTTLGEIATAAGRATDLTRQLLAFSRKQLIKPKVIDLNGRLRGIQRMLARIIGEDVTLALKLGEPLGRIKVDPGQLEQIVVNLAANARDAMPRGGLLTLRTDDALLDEDACRALPLSEPGEYVRLSVTDSGVGMSEEVRERVFEPFYTTKEVGKGTGLGLSTVYGIVRQHQGHITVRSAPGEGTTFEVYFPRVLEPPEPLEVRDAQDTLPRGAETVLVVEDDATVRDIAVRALRRLGYDVLQAAQGEDALRLARGHGGRIHLLVADVIMPGMNGRELAERLTALRTDLRVLYTSGYSVDVIGHHGVLDEGIEFLGKPYSPRALAERVRQVLDRNG